MKRILFFCFVTTSLLLGCLPQKTAGEKTAAKKDAATFWNFGDVREGAVLTHDFTIKNETKNDMTILNILPSCDCVSGTVQQKKLSASESTIVTVRTDTKGSGSGKADHYVYVNTNHPSRKFIKLSFQYTITP